MIGLTWTVEDDGNDELTEAPRPLLTTWHYLRNSLRRCWRTWLALSLVGALLGLGAVVLAPPHSAGTVTLLMAHPASIDGPDGMAMDVSLLNTDEVAKRTVDQLGLNLTPAEFRSTVAANPVTTQILSIAVSGQDDASVVARAQALVNQYLAFRSTQLRSLSGGLISGYETRIASMQDQVKTLTSQYGELSQRGAAGQSQAFEILSRRADLNSQITSMQRAIEDATLQTEAAIDSTHVIDSPRAEVTSARRAMVLAVGSGLIAGAGLGVGLVLFRALVSDRLRRRQDVGIALGAPVRFSVVSKGPRDNRFGRVGRWFRPRQVWRGDDLETLARGLESALKSSSGSRNGSSSRLTASASMNGLVAAVATSTGTRAANGAGANGTAPHLGATAKRRLRPHAYAATLLAHADTPEPANIEATRGALEVSGGSFFASARSDGPANSVAVAAICSAAAAADVIHAAATRLRERGLTVFLVDLSRSGALAERMTQHRDHGDHGLPAPGIWRPSGLPRLALGPRGFAGNAVTHLPADVRRGGWDTSDVVLALVEVDPGIEATHLASWVELVVPLVAAGRSTAELLETTGELVRAASLRLPFAMMVGADGTDESLGLLGPVHGGED
jgi:capsular polysaccharide biosynthesis protein